jgi:hypothetical protein
MIHNQKENFDMGTFTGRQTAKLKILQQGLIEAIYGQNR